MREKPSCEQCRLTWEAYNKKPDCEKCLPQIMLGNETILNVYSAVQSQIRTAGADGIVVDLDHNAVWKYMEKYEIEDQLWVFEKVTKLFHHFLSEDAMIRKLTARRPRK